MSTRVRIAQVGGQMMSCFLLSQVSSQTVQFVALVDYNACHFVIYLGPKAITNGIGAVHQRKIMAAFLEKCPEQYTM